jgi:hypothetical protein
MGFTEETEAAVLSVMMATFLGGVPEAAVATLTITGSACSACEPEVAEVWKMYLCPRDVMRCEQRRPDHHAVVADAGGVHVLAHQAVAQHAVDEGGIGRAGGEAGADDAGAVRRAACHAVRHWPHRGKGLLAPRQVACLEGAGEEIDQAVPGLGDGLGRQLGRRDGERGPGQPPRQRHVAARGPGRGHHELVPL